MEHVLMLGNGFDLYYKHPTKYHNFLQIADFLSRVDLRVFRTIGELLRCFLDVHKDEFIASCYEAHKESYDKLDVPYEKIEGMLQFIADNPWFKYLIESYNQDVGWIDFEKEISRVVNVVRRVIIDSQLPGGFIPEVDNPVDNHILSFFITLDYGCVRNVWNDGRTTSAYTYKLEEKYCIEYPLGSGNTTINSTKIISDLFAKLTDLSEALKLYLAIFTEGDFYYDQESSSNFGNLLLRSNRIVTFNYTKSHQNRFYGVVNHLHGNIDGNIVLGINPDKYDEVDQADPLCIAFKKYHQRVMYGTDSDYLAWITGDHLEYTLTVMGHSLDVTDADIIKELFSKAKEITILYHDTQAKSSYIGNIVKMYGHKGFENMRREKKLIFMNVDSDFSAIIEERESLDDFL